jgi:hypothetical protein
MPPDTDPSPIRPDPHTPVTIGVLNIVFALALMLGGLFYNLAFLSMPLLSYAMNLRDDNQAKVAKDLVAQRDRFRAEEAAAPDEKVRSEIRARREEVESEIAPFKPSIAADARFRDPRYIAHFVADLASGLVLNVLMLASGVGLVFRKAWGRSLAIAVAYLKCARLPVLSISMAFVVAPIAKGLVVFLEHEMPAPGVESVASLVGFLLIFPAGAKVLLGSIYPLAMIVVLGRPEVRAACRPIGSETEARA